MILEYVTVNELCERYRRCRRTLKNWDKNKELDFPKPVRKGRKLYYSLTELRKWEAQFADRFGAKEAAEAA